MKSVINGMDILSRFGNSFFSRILAVVFFFLMTEGKNKLSAQEVKKSPEIAFASDTQAPMWIESLFLRDNNNRKATELLFQDFLTSRPDALFMMGDVVNLGYKENRWPHVDSFLDSMRSVSIPVYGVLGNHEVMGRAAQGEAQFQKRFPEHVRTGYSVVVNSIAMVLLNSNFSTMTLDDQEKQKKWYENEIKKLEGDESVNAIIVGCHHSPFTNSKLVKSSVPVQQQFLPSFFASPKCKLFISGHAHVFEHFKHEGKDFITIGGGGGLTHPLNKKEGCLDDVCSNYKPQFHYITVSLSDESLNICSHRLRPDFSLFEQGYDFSVKLQEKTEAENR